MPYTWFLSMKVVAPLRCLAVVLAILVIWTGDTAIAFAEIVDRAAIEAALQGSGALVLEGRMLERAMFRSLYQERDFQPIWSEQRTESFSNALEEAASHGLDADAYRVSSGSLVQRELLLSDAFLRYASALARGRVWPGDFERDWRIPAPPFDAAKVLEAATRDIASVLRDLVPQDAAYQRLRDALRGYRELTKSGWYAIQSRRPMRLGDSGDNVRRLRARLAVEGFVNPTAGVDPSRYDEVLADSVSRFQAARGLMVDGVTGRFTLAALNISPAARVQQIVLNLERWRSLPRSDDGTRIEVNVPAAIATLYEEDRPVKTTRVIVGAVFHPTPVLRTRMIAVSFNPPWNVPSSILRKEIRPRLRRDPGYLERLGFAFVDTPGGKRLVQMPGPENALGQLKFEMPNPANVYMHDTPDRNLFARPQRTFSHGCIRVDDPRDLAQILLGSDQWSRAAIDNAIATGQTETVFLPHEVPVYVLYWTAFVDSDGTVEFRDDIYGRDMRLAKALAAHGTESHAAQTSNDSRC